MWKPLLGPVCDSPLAVCDYRTVADDDRVPTDIIFPDYLGETYNFWPNSEHRFYYIDQQLPEEAWMIKCFDSATEDDPQIAQCMSFPSFGYHRCIAVITNFITVTPHVSFPYSRKTDYSSTMRESVEVRAFVFYKEATEQQLKSL